MDESWNRQCHGKMAQRKTDFMSRQEVYAAMQVIDLCAKFAAVECLPPAGGSLDWDTGNGREHRAGRPRWRRNTRPCAITLPPSTNLSEASRKPRCAPNIFIFFEYVTT